MKKHCEAVQRYQEKVGLISKTYKLPKVLVEEFAAACSQNGSTQARELTKLMTEYIKKPE